jgi:hypothetical protein
LQLGQIPEAQWREQIQADELDQQPDEERQMEMQTL